VGLMLRRGFSKEFVENSKGEETMAHLLAEGGGGGGGYGSIVRKSFPGRFKRPAGREGSLSGRWD